MRTTLTLLLIVILGSFALAQGTYTQIDYPGAFHSYCWGINNAGDISGGYQDFIGSLHGFLLKNGVYTTIDYPGARFTQLAGLNDLDQVVGNRR